MLRAYPPLGLLSWQRPTDFTAVDVLEVQKVEELLNNRPRAVLGFRTPIEVFSSEACLSPASARPLLASHMQFAAIQG